MTDVDVLRTAVNLIARFTPHSPVEARAVFTARPNTVGEVLTAANLNAKGEPAADAGSKVAKAFDEARAAIAQGKASIAATDEPPEPGIGE